MVWITTLTIQATGRKNAASRGVKIVVDAFDVTTLGRRFQQDALDPVTGAPMVTHTGTWIHGNVNRVWSEGSCDTTPVAGSRAIFTFTGTGVSWIGCQKDSCSGVAKVFVDGAFVKQIANWRPVPIEAFQHEIFRADGLTPGMHTDDRAAGHWWLHRGGCFRCPPVKGRLAADTPSDTPRPTAYGDRAGVRPYVRIAAA